MGTTIAAPAGERLAPPGIAPGEGHGCRSKPQLVGQRLERVAIGPAPTMTAGTGRPRVTLGECAQQHVDALQLAQLADEQEVGRVSVGGAACRSPMAASALVITVVGARSLPTRRS